METETYIQQIILIQLIHPEHHHHLQRLPKSSQSPQKWKIKKESEHQKLHHTQKKSKISQATVLSWGRRMSCVRRRRGNGFCSKPTIPNTLIWGMTEDANSGIKLLPPPAYITHEEMTKTKQFCSGWFFIIVHHTRYRALKLMFPDHISSLSLHQD